MPVFRIEFSHAAHRQFRKLTADAQKRLAPHIDSLATDPRPARAKHLVADGDLYRLRVGSYRVVYAIEDDVLLVLVLKIGHRRDVYRGT